MKHPSDSEKSAKENDKQVTIPSLNDNSNPQQGSSGSRTLLATNKSAVNASERVAAIQQYQHQHQQRAPLKFPPTVKDARKLFIGGLPSDGTFLYSVR